MLELYRFLHVEQTGAAAEIGRRRKAVDGGVFYLKFRRLAELSTRQLRDFTSFSSALRKNYKNRGDLLL